MNRREFLRLSALMTGAAVVAACAPEMTETPQPRQTEQPKKDEPLKYDKPTGAITNTESVNELAEGEEKNIARQQLDVILKSAQTAYPEATNPQTIQLVNENNTFVYALVDVPDQGTMMIGYYENGKFKKNISRVEVINNQSSGEVMAKVGSTNILWGNNNSGELKIYDPVKKEMVTVQNADFMQWLMSIGVSTVKAEAPTVTPKPTVEVVNNEEWGVTRYEAEYMGVKVPIEFVVHPDFKTIKERNSFVKKPLSKIVFNSEFEKIKGRKGDEMLGEIIWKLFYTTSKNQKRIGEGVSFEQYMGLVKTAKETGNFSTIEVEVDAYEEGRPEELTKKQLVNPLLGINFKYGASSRGYQVPGTEDVYVYDRKMSIPMTSAFSVDENGKLTVYGDGLAIATDKSPRSYLISTGVINKGLVFVTFDKKYNDLGVIDGMPLDTNELVYVRINPNTYDATSHGLLTDESYDR